MVVAMKGHRSLPVALEALLDAMQADLLAAPAEDVRDALRETGRSKDGACREIRSVLEEAFAADEGCNPTRTPFNLRSQDGLHRLYRH